MSESSFDGTVRFIARAARMLEDEAHQERHGPRNRRAYLAWVRRHTPKRRRFDGPTRKQARRAWIEMIAVGYGRWARRRSGPKS